MKFKKKNKKEHKKSFESTEQTHDLSHKTKIILLNTNRKKKL